MASKEAIKKKMIQIRERRAMKNTFILSFVIAIILILVLILFKIYYEQLSEIFDLVNTYFFGFIRVLISIGILAFLYLGVANYLEYNKQVIGLGWTIIIFTSVAIFIYFMFDFPSIPLEMTLTLIGGVLFVLYLYLIQD